MCVRGRSPKSSLCEGAGRVPMYHGLRSPTFSAATGSRDHEHAVDDSKLGAVLRRMDFPRFEVGIA